ncbi:winged helix-turn-helix domain-containing protein [Adlercreutzia aquisgranensis]|uniref:Winged helix family transcriptional regulator n=1 Tax=Muribaculaceae bacterium Z82 TaxID=2304548 RepID=A0A7C9JN16_9BACT|nr:helix-turn-helix domain-containing protein [Adlercreutzia aquisgranensis]
MRARNRRGDEYQGGAISVPTYIRHLRTKLEDDPARPKVIQTVFGFGYKLGD